MPALKGTRTRRRAQKANPNTVSGGTYKEMNGRRFTHDPEHKRDHRYDPSEPATAKCWPAENIDAWMRTEDREAADALSQLLDREGVKSASEVPTKKGGHWRTDSLRHSLGGECGAGGHPPWTPILRPQSRNGGRCGPGGTAELPPTAKNRIQTTTTGISA